MAVFVIHLSKPGKYSLLGGQLHWADDNPWEKKQKFSQQSCFASGL